VARDSTSRFGGLSFSGDPQPNVPEWPFPGLGSGIILYRADLPIQGDLSQTTVGPTVTALSGGGSGGDNKLVIALLIGLLVIGAAIFYTLHVKRP